MQTRFLLQGSHHLRRAQFLVTPVLVLLAGIVVARSATAGLPPDAQSAPQTKRAQSIGDYRATLNQLTELMLARCTHEAPEPMLARIGALKKLRPASDSPVEFRAAYYSAIANAITYLDAVNFDIADIDRKQGTAVEDACAHRTLLGQQTLADVFAAPGAPADMPTEQRTKLVSLMYLPPREDATGYSSPDPMNSIGEWRARRRAEAAIMFAAWQEIQSQINPKFDVYDHRNWPIDDDDSFSFFRNPADQAAWEAKQKIYHEKLRVQAEYFERQYELHRSLDAVKRDAKRTLTNGYSFAPYDTAELERLMTAYEIDQTAEGKTILTRVRANIAKANAGKTH